MCHVWRRRARDYRPSGSGTTWRKAALRKFVPTRSESPDRIRGRQEHNYANQGLRCGGYAGFCPRPVGESPHIRLVGHTASGSQARRNSQLSSTGLPWDELWAGALMHLSSLAQFSSTIAHCAAPSNAPHSPSNRHALLLLVGSKPPHNGPVDMAPYAH
jgi:hypothetical protein